jgi:hypothetical protein
MQAASKGIAYGNDCIATLTMPIYNLCCADGAHEFVAGPPPSDHGGEGSLANEIKY